MRNILYILALFVFSSCGKQQDEIPNIKATQKYIKPIHNLYSDYGIMFVQMDNNRIASTNANHLERFYNSYFSDKYPTFESFVSDALEQKIKFDTNKFRGRNIAVFTLDKSVANEYGNSGISYVLGKYCEEGKSGYTFKNLNLPDNIFFAILYYSFRNGYRISFDDVGGYYTIKTKVQ